MVCVFEVSPFDGGWSVKVCDTGEVLFFDTGGQAEREARRLAATCSGGAGVRVFDLRGGLAGEWTVPQQAPLTFPYPLGSPT